MEDAHPAPIAPVSRPQICEGAQTTFPLPVQWGSQSIPKATHGPAPEPWPLRGQGHGIMLSFENTGLGPQSATVSQLSSLQEVNGMNSRHRTVVPKGGDVPASLPVLTGGGWTHLSTVRSEFFSI